MPKTTVIEVTVRIEVDDVADKDIPLVEDHLIQHAIGDFNDMYETGNHFPDEIDYAEHEMRQVSVDARVIHPGGTP